MCTLRRDQTDLLVSQRTELRGQISEQRDWRRWMEGQQRGHGNEYEFSGYLVFQAVQE